MGPIIIGFRSTAASTILILVLCVAAPPALGQQRSDTLETREEQLREARRAKAEHLKPPEPPGSFERLLARVEERLTGGAGANFMGFRPKLGGLKPGAGISGGIVYSPFTPRDPFVLRAELLASLEKYWGVGLSAGYRFGPASVLTYGRYRHMPSEDFFGYGGDSELEDRSNFRLNEAVGGVLLGVRLAPLLFAGVYSSYIASSPGSGKDEDFPNTLTWAAPSTIPSLQQTVRHVALGGWFEFDARDPKPAKRAYKYLTHTEPDVIGMPLASDRGVYVLADLVHYVTTDDTPFDFTRLSLQSQQYIPFRHGRNVFAFREYVALSRTDGGTVPLYMRPALGGAYTLRGYELHRFRDRHALMLNAEYRWQAWIFVDLALFFDAGQVFSRADEIALDDLDTSYGAGARLRAFEKGMARIDLARSVEGTQIHIRLGAYF